MLQGSVEVLAPVSASTSSEEDIRLVICGISIKASSTYYKMPQ